MSCAFVQADVLVRDLIHETSVSKACIKAGISVGIL